MERNKKTFDNTVIKSADGDYLFIMRHEPKKNFFETVLYYLNRTLKRNNHKKSVDKCKKVC